MNDPLVDARARRFVATELEAAAVRCYGESRRTRLAAQGEFEDALSAEAAELALRAHYYDVAASALKAGAR